VKRLDCRLHTVEEKQMLFNHSFDLNTRALTTLVTNLNGADGKGRDSNCWI